MMTILDHVNREQHACLSLVSVCVCVCVCVCVQQQHRSLLASLWLVCKVSQNYIYTVQYGIFGRESTKYTVYIYSSVQPFSSMLKLRAFPS
jgi:hypothetical protein